MPDPISGNDAAAFRARQWALTCWAMSLGTSVLFFWGLHSKCYSLSLVAAAEIIPCMYNLAVYQVQPDYLPACVPRLPASLPLSFWSISLYLHNLCDLFFLPLPVAPLSLYPQGKLPLPQNSPRGSCCFFPPQLFSVQLCWVQLNGGVSLCPDFCL